ncbi:uncharacterized protein [Heterodontus francisci]|uniref:uncharacterized protein isoform X2 n=1 Tax=Heterodontus francisci TaxID=7792 RepID=UPI00355BB038
MNTTDAVKTLNTKKVQSQNEATPQGIAKKKCKKKKETEQALTKEDRKRDELEKAGKHFQSNVKEYELFLDRMDNWLKTHHQQAMELFSKYDKIGNGILHYEEFKLGMRDLNIPCVEVQLHILARLLDQNNNGTIDYMELGSGLDKTRYHQNSSDENEEEVEAKEVKRATDRITVREDKEEHETRKEAETCLSITKEDLTRCPGYHVGLWKPAQVSESSTLTSFIFSLRAALNHHEIGAVTSSCLLQLRKQSLRLKVSIQATKATGSCCGARHDVERNLAFMDQVGAHIGMRLGNIHQE